MKDPDLEDIFNITDGKVVANPTETKLRFVVLRTLVKSDEFVAH